MFRATRTPSCDGKFNNNWKCSKYDALEYHNESSFLRTWECWMIFYDTYHETVPSLRWGQVGRVAADRASFQVGHVRASQDGVVAGTQADGRRIAGAPSPWLQPGDKREETARSKAERCPEQNHREREREAPTRNIKSRTRKGRN